MPVADIGKAAHMVYNKGCQLVAGETCDCPCGESDTMDGADILHTVMVGQQSGNIAETAAVTCVYYEQQDKHQNHQDCRLSHFCDTLCYDD